jgi:hypothetical protein
MNLFLLKSITNKELETIDVVEAFEIIIDKLSLRLLNNHPLLKGYPILNNSDFTKIKNDGETFVYKTKDGFMIKIVDIDNPSQYFVKNLLRDLKINHLLDLGKSCLN